MTENPTALLGDAPEAVTTTLPVVAPGGTTAEIRVSVQLVTRAATPLIVTLPFPCVDPKPDPVIAT